MIKYLKDVITIAIIEDIQETRNGLAEFLRIQDNMLCETTVESVEDFLNACPPLIPDVVLLDIGLPGISGINGIKLIKGKYPDTSIMMLTVYEDPERIFSALVEGAAGYIIKNTPLIKIKEAVEELFKGGAPMSPQIARKVVEHFNNKTAVPSGEHILTIAEKKIVAGIVDGLSYKLIAAANSISIETVRFHIKNIYKKLHVNCKAEVIAKSFHGQI